MSLNHEFLVVDNSFNTSDTERLYKYIKKSDIIREVQIHDDFLQRLLFGKYKIWDYDIFFSEWGIDVVEGHDLLKWNDFLDKNEKKLCNEKSFIELREIIVFAIRGNYKIVHFGI